MIDKVQIAVSDFKIAQDDNIRIFPASHLAKETDVTGGVLYQCGSRFIYGSKAVLNDKLWNLTIKPGFGMEVHFNPAVVVNGNNFYRVNEKEFRKSLDVVSDSLIDQGVYFDFENANITRLDVANDKEMNEPFPVYVPLFRFMNAKRARPIEYENGYYFTNGNRTLVFYDKNAEMVRNKKPVSGGGNVMRCEYRLCSKDAVNRFAAFGNSITSMRKVAFADLAEFHRNSIANFAFADIPEPETSAYSYNTEKEIILFFKAKYKRNGLAMYHKARAVLERFGSIGNYRDVLLDCGYHRSYVFKHIKAVKQAVSFVEQVESRHGKPSIGSLYAEIHERFIREAA